MKKALVTGGAGFIGSHLVRYLLQKDFEVVSIDNFLTSSKNNIEEFLSSIHFHFLEKDLITTDFNTVLKNKTFEVIYHLASPASPPRYTKYPIETLRVNGEVTQRLLTYAKTTKSNIFIFGSTSEAYGDPLVHPQTENYWGNVNPVGIRSCYDEAKRYGEALCMAYLRRYHIDTRIVRIFNTYGPRMEKDDGRVISNFLTQVLTGKDVTVYGDGTQTRSFSYVSDLVEGLYKMYEKNVKGEVINLGNPHETSVNEIARLILEMTKSSSKIVFKPLPPDDPKKRKPDITKAKKLLGWEPTVSLEEGLKKTIDYFKHIV